MPIGVGGAALIGLGGAALTAGAGIYGASKAAKAQNKAADQASDTAYNTANLNNQLARDMYGANAARLDPFASNGLMASNALTDMLLGTHSFNPNASPYAGTLADPANPSSPQAQAGQPPYTQAQIDQMWHDGVPGNAEAAENANAQWYASHQQAPAANSLAPMASQAPAGAATAPQTVTPAPNALLAPVPAPAPLQAQAQQAVAQGADPAAVNARMMELTTRPRSVSGGF